MSPMDTASTKQHGALDWLRQIPVKNAERAFLIERDGTRMTYGELDRRARAVAGALRDRGIVRGDKIVISAPNSIPLSTLYLGCLYAGIVAVPLNPGSTDDEAAFIAGKCGAKALAHSLDLAQRVPKWSSLPAFAIEPFVESAAAGRTSTGPRPFEGMSDEDDLLIIYTSGTTASPKGVVHRVSDLIDNARLFGRAVGLSPENRFYNLLPMTYLGGYYNLLLLPYACESSVVIDQPFSAASALDFWTPIVRNKADTLWLVPSIVSLLLKMDRGTVGETYCRSHIKLALCGTAPLPLPIRREFEKRYGITLHENYGLTETLFLTANAPASGVVDGSVGRALQGVAVRIVDDSGADAASGAEGEIIVRTPFLMRACQHTDKDGQYSKHGPADWFATGDLGSLDDGRLAITGRKKDLIIRGGVNIAPTSIEELIYTNPAVLECAVVGVPHPLMGEDIVAVVKPAPNADFKILRNELATLCVKKLSKVRQPARFIELADLPRTASGKIQKNKIRAWLISRGDEPAAAARPSAAGAAEPKEGFLKASRVVTDIGEAMSIKYNTFVYELRRRNEDVTVLSLGEAFFDIPPMPTAELLNPAGYHYSHSRGIPELRQKITDYFLSEYDVAIDAEKEIIVTAGSKIAIYMSLLAIINPNEEVIIHEPAWVSYAEQVRLCHGEPVMIPHDESVFEFEKHVTNRTRLIIINSPNNPSGKVYTLEELSFLNQLARKHNLYVLSDEAYSDFLLDPKQFISMGNLDPEKSHTLIVNSISKNFGISGWRLGYVISNPQLIKQLLKLNQHLITCAPTNLQHYIARNFGEIIRITKPQIRSLIERRAQLSAFMDEIGLKRLQGEATFYFFVSIAPSRFDSEAFCDELLFKHHVCAVPGIGYGPSCGRFIRVSVGAESGDRIEAGLRKIAALIQSSAA